MKKWMYITIAVFVLLLILVLTGRKSVHSEVSITAPAESVWEVLTDVENYSEWNPVMKPLDGTMQTGNKVKYRFTQDEKTKSEIEARVVEMIPNQLLRQNGGIPLILTFDHRYRLEIAQRGTKVIIHEEYRGIGVNFWNPQPIEEAYQRLNEALKARVESISTRSYE